MTEENREITDEKRKKPKTREKLDHVRSRKERFEVVGEARVQRAVKALQLLKSVCNHRNYEYDHRDAQFIIRTLKDEVSEIETLFKLNLDQKNKGEKQNEIRRVFRGERR